MNLTNTVVVDRLKERFTDRMCGIYNTETYYIEDCTTNNSKYTIPGQLRDFQLEIFFLENNLIDYKGQLVSYFEKGEPKFIVSICHLQEG